MFVIVPACIQMRKFYTHQCMDWEEEKEEEGVGEEGSVCVCACVRVCVWGGGGSPLLLLGTNSYPPCCV